MAGTLLVFCGVDRALASSSSGPQTFTYDTLRRLTGSTDATGYQVQYAYDAGSRLTAETTPSGTATFAWDLLYPRHHTALALPPRRVRDRPVE